MSILSPLKSLTHLAGQAFAATLHGAVHARTAEAFAGFGRAFVETSAAPTPTPGVAAERPDAPTPERGASGHPNSLGWCAAEMEQVADILLTCDSMFALGYAHDLRRAAATDPTLGNDPSSIHDRRMRQLLDEDRRK